MKYFSPCLNTYFQIYLLLWFWLFSLVVVGGLQLLVRLASLLVPPVRTAALLLSTNSYRGCHAANVRCEAERRFQLLDTLP